MHRKLTAYLVRMPLIIICPILNESVYGVYILKRALESGSLHVVITRNQAIFNIFLKRDILEKFRNPQFYTIK